MTKSTRDQLKFHDAVVKAPPPSDNEPYGLTVPERMLLLLMRHYSIKGTLRSNIRLGTIAEKLGVSTATVKRWSTSCTTKGWIVPVDGRTKNYRDLVVPVHFLKASSSSSSNPPDEEEESTEERTEGDLENRPETLGAYGFLGNAHFTRDTKVFTSDTKVFTSDTKHEPPLGIASDTNQSEPLVPPVAPVRTPRDSKPELLGITGDTKQVDDKSALIEEWLDHYVANNEVGKVPAFKAKCRKNHDETLAAAREWAANREAAQPIDPEKCLHPDPLTDDADYRRCKRCGWVSNDGGKTWEAPS